ncbi:ArnT family glycosyltransferase [Bacillus massiliigorillae]|uniref:ArnT family glycosyltransferase n=1 Tax=Bacillus massiliigorillae TaxID=1243664 RepID=UPI00039FBEF1|nr:glycosyltransferase family 39 protein [Bacillus massiliigorillae]
MKGSTRIIVPLLIVLAAFILRITILIKYGLDYTLDSDDVGYVGSAQRLLESGMLTYHFEDIPTVHLMPGEPFMLAVIFKIFGLEYGIWAARVVHIVIGCMTIVVAMKLAAHWVGERWSWIVGILAAVFPPFIQVDNLLLTEGPYTLATLMLIYGTIKLAEKQNNRWFFFVMITYFVALYFRVNIALYPLVLFLYLLIKKYPWKVFKRQIIISIVALLVVMGPWWIRNYMVFDKFIPMTGGSGDPLLLGTFQGEGYPGGSYQTSVAEAESRSEETDILGRMHERKVEAQERMKEWWETNPQSMLKSYLYLKPIEYMKGIFYWKPVFDIPLDTVVKCYQVILITGIAGWLSVGLIKKYRAEMILIMGYVFINVALNSYYFAYPRYNYPLVILWMIGAVFLIYWLKKLLLSRRVSE